MVGINGNKSQARAFAPVRLRSDQCLVRMLYIYIIYISAGTFRNSFRLRARTQRNRLTLYCQAFLLNP